MRRGSVEFNRENVIDLFKSNGYVVDDDSSYAFYVSSKDYPNAKIAVYYDTTGVTVKYSGRRLRRFKTILKNVSEELESEIRRYNLRNKEDINRQRLQDALFPFKVDTNSYSHNISGRESSARARLRLKQLDYFKDFYSDDEYSYDEINIILYESDKKPLVELKTDNLEVITKSVDFIKELQDNWFAAGI
jgi:hypothetical protein